MATAPSGYKGDRPSKLSGTATPFIPSWHSRVKALESRVKECGAGILEGNTLNISEFERLAPEIVRAGFVTQNDADYVLDGIRNGFDLESSSQ